MYLIQGLNYLAAKKYDFSRVASWGRFCRIRRFINKEIYKQTFNFARLGFLLNEVASWVNQTLKNYLRNFWPEN